MVSIKRTCRIVLIADHKEELRESEKKYKYIDLDRELKALEDSDIREKVETIRTAALLSSARILWRVLETWGDLFSLKLQ